MSAENLRGSSVSVVCSDAREAETAPALDLPRWEHLASTALVAEGAVGELTVTFIDRDEMTRLNEEHMAQMGPTDVLSFPLDDDPLPGVPTLLGDVVISPSVAATQAPEHAGTVDDEIALLVVHGILHVLGHDHAEPDETAAMQARERTLLEEHHWTGPAPAGFRQTHDV